MGFRENLLDKIRINRLAGAIRESMGPPDSGRRADLEAMRQLVEMAGWEYRKERDLDLYILDSGEILALDNELKIYNTTAADIALRKSPTVKEMISIRNAVKILNDKNVVVSRKADTLERIRDALIGALDLSYTAADIDALADDGRQALKNGYADGVIENINLFAELLEYQPPPKAFRISHHHIRGRRSQPKAGEWRFGPAVLYSLMHNTLKMATQPVSSLDEEGLRFYNQVAGGEKSPDFADEKVWAALGQAVMKNT